MCHAFADLVLRPDLQMAHPVNFNPNVQWHVKRIHSAADNIVLTDLQDYCPFVYLISQSCLILSESGGIQEEAPSLGKSVLGMRDTTKRLGAIEAGGVRPLETACGRIVQEATRLLDDEEAYAAMSLPTNPMVTAWRRVASRRRSCSGTGHAGTSSRHLRPFPVSPGPEHARNEICRTAATLRRTQNNDAGT